jgi:hypothetical protein
MLRRLRQRFVWESTAPTGSKLSHLVAGERFYGSFSYLFPKQGTEYNPDRYPRARPDYRAIILGIQNGMST